MPIYEYNCDHCSYKFDKLVLSASARVTCPLCQGKVKKLMSTFAVGGSQPAAGGMPDIAGPKMCTNCGPTPGASVNNQSATSSRKANRI